MFVVRQIPSRLPRDGWPAGESGCLHCCSEVARPGEPLPEVPLCFGQQPHRNLWCFPVRPLGLDLFLPSFEQLALVCAQVRCSTSGEDSYRVLPKQVLIVRQLDGVLGDPGLDPSRNSGDSLCCGREDCTLVFGTRGDAAYTAITFRHSSQGVLSGPLRHFPSMAQAGAPPGTWSHM